MCTVLIVYTSEAQDWATYLKLVLETSHHFPQGSIILYLVDEKHSVQNEDCSIFSSSKCILLLLSMAFLDIQNDPVMKNIFEKVLYPPSKVIAFLCGVSESDGLVDYFEHWDNWKKLDNEDEPAFYVSTVLEIISEEKIAQLENQDTTVDKLPLLKQSMDPSLEEHGEFPLPLLQFCLPEEGSNVSNENSPRALSPTVPEEKVCFTVQPRRIQCGTQVDVYIIMREKLNIQASMEVKFICEHSTKSVSGTAVNEFVVRAQSPDMPAGEVSLHLYVEETIVCSTHMTYYTEMDEISSYFKKVLDPVQFMCQAFNITFNVPEALDNMLTDSFEKQMPSNGLQVFGVGQLDEENKVASQRDVELPTLLHFSAKHGLKKLTRILLQCPGALQAYSTANKNGDYPNTLAEKNGFRDLRQFMDDYVETVDLVKSHIEEPLTTPGDEDIYEPMANASQNIDDKYCLQEDIYESMTQLNPELDLYEDFSGSLNGSFNAEDAMLRKFFQVKAEKFFETTAEDPINNDYCGSKEDDEENVYICGELEEEEEEEQVEEEEEEEDPYKMCFAEEIYDIIEEGESLAPAVLNRPPAPVPRPSLTPESEASQTYISTVFSSKNALYAESIPKESQHSNVSERTQSCSEYDSYTGLKTPGQRQLISLQERVKLGSLTVEEAVQEFKAWQFDEEKRSQSIRFQKENLQKLRKSITRRQKEKGKTKKPELDITSPLKSVPPCWGSQMNLECSVYEPAPSSMTQQHSINKTMQRRTWHTGSTSSNSSSGSNRQSTQSTISFSSGPDGDLEEQPENSFPPPPPPPPRPRPAAETPPTLPPPRVPPRIPERFSESMINERYVSTPARSHNPTAPNRPMPATPTSRRTR